MRLWAQPVEIRKDGDFGNLHPQKKDLVTIRDWATKLRLLQALAFQDPMTSYGSYRVLTIVLAHITLGRKKAPFYINIRNPIPQKV